jgi:hypothetical protein
MDFYDNSAVVVDYAERRPSSLSFEVNDRVERLNGDSTGSNWGYVIGRACIGGSDDWLVTDDAGITHLDTAPELAHLPTRGIIRQRQG